MSFKDIILLDEDDNYRFYNAEEILAKRLNRWIGWKCSAGVNSLHITADGNLFRGTCKVGGLLGNVFDSGVRFPKVWVTCNKEWCMCGTDMNFLKSKNKESISIERSQLKRELETDPKAISVGLSLLEYNKDFPIMISWDIGRRCNFSCSYCPPSTANNFEAYKSWESLKFAVDSLQENFFDGRKGKIIFTGGEPTINPAYLDLVKYLRSFGHLIHTQTNGSRHKNYILELAEYSSIGFSIHFEQYNPEKLLETFSALVLAKENSKPYNDNWIGIRLMTPPGKLAEVLDFYHKVLAIPHFNKHAFLNLSPVYQKQNGSQLMDYSKEELDEIIKLS